MADLRRESPGVCAVRDASPLVAAAAVAASAPASESTGYSTASSGFTAQQLRCGPLRAPHHGKRSRSLPPDIVFGVSGIRIGGDSSNSTSRFAAFDTESPGCPRTPSWLCYLRWLWELFEHDVVCLHILTHQPAARLQAVHVQATCHLVLLFVVGVFITYSLQVVMLPAMLAAGTATLLEPPVFFFVDAWVRWLTPGRLRPALRGVLHQDVGNSDNTDNIHVRVELPVWLASGRARASGCVSGCVPEVQGYLTAASRKMWCVFIVTVTIVAMFMCLTLIGIWVISSVTGVDWEKFAEGERMKFVQQELAKRGLGNPDEIAAAATSFAVKTLGIEFIFSIVSIASRLLITVLFLFYFLIDSAIARSFGKEPWRRQQRVIMSQVSRMKLGDDIVRLTDTFMGNLRMQMRVFIQQKFYLSVIKSILIGGLYAILGVALWEIWAVLTLVFNFMPMGSAVSTIAPMPFVILDSSKSYLVVAVCFLWPVLVHNAVGNIVEPRVFARTLSLHPVTVLLAFGFWTGIWGVLGALVCVPMTALVRVSLQQMADHPYVCHLLGLVEGSRRRQLLQADTDSAAGVGTLEEDANPRSELGSIRRRR